MHELGSNNSAKADIVGTELNKKLYIFYLHNYRRCRELKSSIIFEQAHSCTWSPKIYRRRGLLRQRQWTDLEGLERGAYCQHPVQTLLH